MASRQLLLRFSTSFIPEVVGSGTNLSGTDLHLSEGLRAGQHGVNPNRNDAAILYSFPLSCVAMRTDGLYGRGISRDYPE